MFGERRTERTVGTMESLKKYALALAKLFTIASPEIAFAEPKAPEPIGTMESLGATDLAEHVEGKEAIRAKAEACKAAYDAAKGLPENTGKPLWIIIDTATGGTIVDDHLALAKEGLDALKDCFAKSNERPRLAQVINTPNGQNTGVSMRPMDGSFLESLLVQAEPSVNAGQKMLSQSLTLDLAQNDPSFQDVRDTLGGLKPREVLQNVDSIALGYTATRATDGGNVWEFNGQMGFTTGTESTVIARGSAGLQTVLSPVDGGRTTVGVTAELSLTNGHLDPQAGAFLVTNLGTHRPDLVLSVTVSPNNGNLELGTNMALRFSRDLLVKN